MKVINFTAVEILPKLLSKEKTQTIRPAWKTPTKEGYMKKGKLNATHIKGGLVFSIEKPPRFKVGEEVKLMWNQRSDFHIFNKITGEGKYISGNVSLNYVEKWMEENGWFDKILGIVEITEVFEIELHFAPFDNMGRACVINMKDSLFSDRAQIAKLDGFKDTVEMFVWFNKKYDLSNPKKFYVYRWKWK